MEKGLELDKKGGRGTRGEVFSGIWTEDDGMEMENPVVDRFGSC
jgi:hypothetical protein